MIEGREGWVHLYARVPCLLTGWYLPTADGRQNSWPLCTKIHQIITLPYLTSFRECILKINTGMFTLHCGDLLVKKYVHQVWICVMISSGGYVERH